ncbi:MAG: SUMF1/EgtB/PvdO family nonheme iron enzyme [Planctomycetota bacterium]|jgi:formylglycine-generating enzyme required for sulfatase activity
MKRVLPLTALLLFLVSAAQLPGAEIPAAKSFTNSMGMKFVRIEPGEFKMGQLNSPLPAEVLQGKSFLWDGDYDEKPVHRVRITKPFYMGVVEVTNYQYELFDPKRKAERGRFNGLSKDDDEAVINVNWYDAQAFCKWLSQQEGLTYRLPTEAEWEYACRAGTETNYYCGNLLPEEYHKNAWRTKGPVPVSLHVGKTPANPWGLYDMHGNVEEWCSDWYGPYTEKTKKDPVGYDRGVFKVLRGGSHGTGIFYLRSANRLGAVPENRNWMFGFRVVLAELPSTKPLPVKTPLNQLGVVQRDPALVSQGPDPEKPYFKGPRKYTIIPHDAAGPVFASHNHAPGLTECPNGDMLTAWFSTVTEGGREMTIAASRLVRGADQWQQASAFWDAPDRNDTTCSLWNDGKGRIYHFNGVSNSAASTYILCIRSSDDSGATWTGPRIAMPEHKIGQVTANTCLRLPDGTIVMPNDDQQGASRVWLSSDETLTWQWLGGNIKGIHPAVAALNDGRLIVFGRGDGIDGMMPMSISNDRGKTYTYKASEFPPIGGTQRCVLLKLKQGPLFFASFAGRGTYTTITDATGNERQVRGLFAAVSLDDGQTWVNKRLITDDGPGKAVECTGGGLFTLSPYSAEYRGYMQGCQSADGLVHLITSRNHYAFNLKWLLTPAPKPAFEPLKVRTIVETFDKAESIESIGWFPYKVITDSFNDKGQYVIDSAGSTNGINRIVGEGSFDITLTLSSIKVNPKTPYAKPSIITGFKDALDRTVFMTMNSKGISLMVKDNESNPVSTNNYSNQASFSSPLVPAKIRLVWNAKDRRYRVFYGRNSSEAITELPASVEGVYLGSEFTESASLYILVNNGVVEVDHCEIRPLGI